MDMETLRTRAVKVRDDLRSVFGYGAHNCSLVPYEWEGTQPALQKLNAANGGSDNDGHDPALCQYTEGISDTHYTIFVDDVAAASLLLPDLITRCEHRVERTPDFTSRQDYPMHFSVAYTRMLGALGCHAFYRQVAKMSGEQVELIRKWHNVVERDEGQPEVDDAHLANLLGNAVAAFVCASGKVPYRELFQAPDCHEGWGITRHALRQKPVIRMPVNPRDEEIVRRSIDILLPDDDLAYEVEFVPE